MNQVRPPRSCWYIQPNVLQILLLTIGTGFVAYPGWSLPPLASHSAIDLIEREGTARSQDLTLLAPEAKQESMTSEGVKDIDLTHEAKADGLRGQESGSGSQKPERQNAKRFTPHAELDAQALNPEPSVPLDLDPQIIRNSPVLQRWLKQVPNVLTDIKNDPSFRTRLRLGYAQFPSANQASGLSVGIEDVFLGRSGLTLSADYQTAFNGKREAWGTDLRYYVRPLGSYINVAPIVGYRHLETTRYTTDGVNVGLRLLVVPSRTGAADISVTQSWVSPGSDGEVGLTTLSFGYALNHNLRLSTDIQKQNSRFRSDSRVDIGFEWMF